MRSSRVRAPTQTVCSAFYSLASFLGGQTVSTVPRASPCPKSERPIPMQRPYNGSKVSALREKFSGTCISSCFARILLTQFFPGGQTVSTVPASAQKGVPSATASSNSTAQIQSQPEETRTQTRESSLEKTLPALPSESGPSSTTPASSVAEARVQPQHQSRAQTKKCKPSVAEKPTVKLNSKPSYRPESNPLLSTEPVRLPRTMSRNTLMKRKASIQRRSKDPFGIFINSDSVAFILTSLLRRTDDF